MFSTEGTIDAIQNGKKTLVKMLVSNEVIAKSMNEFIDAQTAYTKSAVAASSEAAATINKEMVRAFQEFGKFDYKKFGEGVMKAWQAQQKNVFGM